MTPAKPKTTIYHVANEAGVAISTVSKVLSNKGGVSQATRHKVQQAIDRLGYIPSLAARGLPSGRTGIIGLVFAFAPDKLFNDPYLLTNLVGIKECLDELDYNLLISTAKNEDPSSSFDQLFRSRYFDGVIILETSEIHKLGLHHKLLEQQLPWVVMGFPEGISPCYAVYVDDYHAGRQVAEHLVGLGHTTFAIVNAFPRPSGVDERVRGFQDYLAEVGITVDPDLIVEGDFTSTSGYQLAKQLLFRPNRPSAIFAINDRIALGVMRWAQEQGLRVPDDFSIVGYDDIEAASQSIPALTTIRQPGYTVGREVVKMLFDLMENKHAQHSKVLQSELIIRGTTRQVKNNAK